MLSISSYESFPTLPPEPPEDLEDNWVLPPLYQAVTKQPLEKDGWNVIDSNDDLIRELNEKASSYAHKIIFTKTTHPEGVSYFTKLLQYHQTLKADITWVRNTPRLRTIPGYQKFINQLIELNSALKAVNTHLKRIFNISLL